MNIRIGVSTFTSAREMLKTSQYTKMRLDEIDIYGVISKSLNSGRSPLITYRDLHFGLAI